MIWTARGLEGIMPRGLGAGACPWHVPVSYDHRRRPRFFTSIVANRDWDLFSDHTGLRQTRRAGKEQRYFCCAAYCPDHRRPRALTADIFTGYEGR